MQREQDSPPSCDYRVYVFGPLEVCKRDADGAWQVVEKEAWGKGRPARSVFKRLLTAPGRRLSRGRLQEDLWPDMDFELADKCLYNAMTQVRNVIGKELVKTIESIYELAGQSQLWVDSDACEQLLKAAEDQGSASPQSLPLLEEARALLERGEFLTGEGGTWVYGLRKKSEDMLRQCRMWLAESYETRGKLWQAGEQYRALLHVMPPDEDALRAWMELLHRHGKLADVAKCYQDTKDAVEAQGFALSPAMEQFMCEMKRERIIPPRAQITMPPTFAGMSLAEFARDSLFDMVPSWAEGIPVLQTRRQVLHHLVMLGSTALVLSPYAIPFQSAYDTIQLSLLPHLEVMTTDYWRVRANVSLDVVGSIAEHFRVVVTLLQRALPSEIAQRIHSLAANTAQLLGEVLFDLQDFALAYVYYVFSIKAAQVASNHTLWGKGIGHLALLLMYWGVPDKALSFLHEVRQLSIQNTRITCWLCAIEAEVHAHLGKHDACIAALQAARTFLEHETLEDDPYVTGFNRSQLAGYEGACFIKLRQPEHALPALQEALALLRPDAIRRRSRLLTDMGMAYAQQGKILETSMSVQKALTITARTKSQSVLERVRMVYQEMEPWKTTEAVQQLARQLERTQTLITE